MYRRLTILAPLCLFFPLGCGNNDANAQMIGGECAGTSECENAELTCLTEFRGGYCGSEGCASDADCPQDSICVTHVGNNYCFLTCVDKVDCNENRTPDNENNCGSNIVRVDGGDEKACIPPSSGD